MGRKKKAAATTYEVRLSQTALQNLDEITGYIAFIKHQPLSAIKLGDAIIRTIEKIAVNPFVFKECEELTTRSKIYRRAVCYSWSIIYKILAEEILIPGIIHQSRKPAAFRKLRTVK